ncbi:tRNA pseudouridine(38-40) synthase TruA [Pontiella agarivorans]|uniref:tRNA pseudouridine synthase A n=1 Tax=Pontiella agarivorans TaxID=3038953 RepID=A0ABU5MUN1_9BACT|nr:tRNA pseudouridine(38-40) synthase TruA [Pontiella agarivorans]MDZ8117903.1 tRNA pseudouridine(38-40) synthase TruA [Pontiella agarivorans]
MKVKLNVSIVHEEEKNLPIASNDWKLCGLMSTRYKITVSYDGTNYSGWQVQPDHRTVQGELERLLAGMTEQKHVRVESSGRTDAGVHARAQVAHFVLPKKVDTRYFMRGINAQLDRDIRVTSFKVVPDDFHARFGAVGKEYRYFIYNGQIVPPTKRLYRLQEARPLDVERMRTAAALLVGDHDFAPFSVNPKRELHGTVRTIHSFSVRKQGADITLAVRGSGFLYKMVRSLAGILIDVGIGRREPEIINEILAHGKRTAVVRTAQPQGLFLWNVFY